MFASFSSVFTVEFEQVNVSWETLRQTITDTISVKGDTILKEVEYISLSASLKFNFKMIR